mmetsp:Transcript_26668/g.57964  ORF Transcript_26668/g.57964 Transcript_26668/m.57964 type:complete len:241 (+) Transcript_26668:1782-2504(+)
MLLQWQLRMLQQWQRLPLLQQPQLSRLVIVRLQCWHVAKVVTQSLSSRLRLLFELSPQQIWNRAWACCLLQPLGSFQQLQHFSLGPLASPPPAYSSSVPPSVALPLPSLHFPAPPPHGRWRSRRSQNAPPRLWKWRTMMRRRTYQRKVRSPRQLLLHLLTLPSAKRRRPRRRLPDSALRAESRRSDHRHSQDGAQLDRHGSARGGSPEPPRSVGLPSKSRRRSTSPSLPGSWGHAAHPFW